MTKPPADLAIFEIDADTLNSDAARRARWAGLRLAKQQAMRTAAVLSWLGLPLLIFILLVSGLHVWETIAGIRPAWVQEWRPHWAAYYIVAALFTVGIDLAALYLMAANNTLAFAGMRREYRAVGCFLVATFLLNAAFVVRYASDLPVSLRDVALPVLDILFAIILPAFIPISLLAVEHARERLGAARLRLLVDVRTLEELSTSVLSKTDSGQPDRAEQRAQTETIIRQIVPLVADGATVLDVQSHYNWTAQKASWYHRQASARLNSREEHA